MRIRAKSIVLGLILIAAAKPAHASLAKFHSLICRSYDYYQLGGDRKVLEIAIRQTQEGIYGSTVANIYEVRQASGEFYERDRTTTTDFQGLTCLQAAPTDEPRLVTCATAGVKTYVSIERVDRTLVMSAFSTRPGAVIKTSTFEGSVMGEVGFKEYTGINTKDCVMN